MVHLLLSIFIQRDRGQSLQSKLVAYLAQGEELDVTDEKLLFTLNEYEALLVASERKRYKFPLRWNDQIVLARYSRSAKNELDGRSLRYNSNYIALRTRCSKGLTTSITETQMPPTA